MLKPVSKKFLNVLSLMQKLGFIGDFEVIHDGKTDKVVVELNGRLNKCGTISPNFPVSMSDIPGWVDRVLPSRKFGHIMISTNHGVLDHTTAYRRKLGGKVLGFFY
mmetsp:Transcript_52767/g.115293  ORF Transcript_52767/g.115293 Transcript_52767/m.115293 type:complete len:106 (-) Transcript_52767:171-488(-)